MTSIGQKVACYFALAIVRCGAQIFAGAQNIGLGDMALSEDKPASGPTTSSAKNATVIKKYANRRLYNTATSTYVTLEDLSKMVKEGSDFIVYDAKTGEDITRSVLTQIIFEEEGKEGNTMLPVNFLRQLIRFYGDSMQGMVPGYLEFSMGNLTREQDKLRQSMPQTMSGAFSGDALKTMEDAAKRNMALFQDSLKMFAPFGGGLAGAMPPGFTNPFAPTPAPARAEPAAPTSGPSRDDLQVLKDQLTAMQQKIDSLSK